jgi:hypothetical protein
MISWLCCTGRYHCRKTGTFTCTNSLLYDNSYGIKAESVIEALSVSDLIERFKQKLAEAQLGEKPLEIG